MQFIFATGRYFHFWAHIIFFVACTVFVCMNYFQLNIAKQLINLTSEFIIHFIECSCTIFENISHLLYKQKLFFLFLDQVGKLFLVKLMICFSLISSHNCSIVISSLFKSSRILKSSTSFWYAPTPSPRFCSLFL